MDTTVMKGIDAMRWARELSKLPEGCFTIAFFPCSRTRGTASARLTVKEGCRWRAQLPHERFSVDSENLFLFTDGDGEPRMCYAILIRYMGFPQDGFKLHRIDWLGTGEPGQPAPPQPQTHNSTPITPSLKT